MFVLQPSFASDLPKPTIIVITGAFMHHIAYNDFAQSLSHTGHRVLFPELASSWSLRPTGEPVKVDVEALRCHIVQQVDAGNEIILVMHSYGCIIGGAAAKGLSKKQQEAKGEKGGVLGLIFIAGYIVEEGTAVKDTLPGGVLESTEEV
jgi:pimeloyl-ACP methyl ester carboxylesterase